MTPIIPAELLHRHDQEIRQVVAGSTDGTADVDDEECRALLRYYRLFSSEEMLRQSGLGALDSRTRFYNRYYWFSKFVKLWAARHGADAGLEQQLFKLLEHAGFEVDWQTIEGIDERTEREAAGGIT